MKEKLRNHHVLIRGKHFLSCWRSLAKGAVFSGLEVDVLSAECDKVRAVDDEILRLETALRGLRLQRRKSRRGLAAMLIRFASGVRADPRYGEDCSFYRALGFVPISENRSGRPQKPR
jgi:hypothetical protein